jgi:hypothetical protein
MQDVLQVHDYLHKQLENARCVTSARPSSCLIHWGCYFVLNNSKYSLILSENMRYCAEKVRLCVSCGMCYKEAGENGHITMHAEQF